MPRNIFSKAWLYIIIFILSGCATVQVKNIPEPPFSAKLRVMVLAVTASQPKTHWSASDEEFSRFAVKNTGRILQQKGIYEVVPQSDLARALGNQKVAGWEWISHNWALARDMGRAVHADYILTVERGASNLIYWKMTLINMRTGRQFAAANHVAKGQDYDLTRREFRKHLQEAYRDIFQEAKGDLFETALRRGKIAQRKAGENGIRQGQNAKLPHIPTPPTRDKTFETVRKNDDKAGGKARIVVYDLETVKHLEIASLILSDALREELYRNSHFVLISREDIQHIMDEVKLQKSGFVDEKRAVQLGNWLAANEIVTGKLAVLGGTYVLSVKRTDMGTMAALGMGSLKCPVGKEEDLLEGIPGIAKRLTAAR